MKKLFVFITCLLMFGSCRLHYVDHCPQPDVCIPDQYSFSEKGKEVLPEWWKEFGEEQLNRYMEIAFCNNYGLKQAWDRLCQARAEVGIAGAPRIPDLSLLTRFEYEEETINDVVINKERTYSLTPTLVYEIDLWKRIDSAYRAARWNYCGTLEDLEETAWLLSGVIMDTWLTIRQQQGFVDVIQEQIKSNQTIADLIDVRFSVGESTLLNVLQQQLTLENTAAQLPPTYSVLETARHQMSVLLGMVPETCEGFEVEYKQMTLPPFPDLGSPSDLLWKRPDLRAAFRKLVATDYELASAIADCFPKLTLKFTDAFGAQRIREILDNELLNVVLDLVAPIVDGGRRRSEVLKRRCIVRERWNFFTELFLNAVQEVEDAIIQEYYQRDFIRRIELQIELAKKNLQESGHEYSNGLVEYLTVIAAIQRLQTLQLQDVEERTNLLRFRANLYRALGGTTITRCL